MVFTSAELPITISIVFAIAVAIANSVALILIEGIETAENRSKPQRHAPFLASIAIATAWAGSLGWQNTSLSMAVLAMVGIIPLMIVWITLKSPAPPVPISVSDRFVPSATQIDSKHRTLAQAAFDPCDGPVSASEAFRIADNTVNSPNVTQWLTRSRTSDGETIEGGVRIEFVKNQRDATIHVSFCPPFQNIPELTTEDLDAADLEIRVAAIFPFGMRLTVRRPANSNVHGTLITEDAYRIGFVAFAASIRRVA